MVILALSSNFQNYIKKTNKIPEYARDYKKEYLFIRGINKMCLNFISKYETDSRKRFVSEYYDSIKYFIKRFLKGQERGKLQDISSLILRKYDFSNVEDLYQNMIYDFEEDEKRSDDNPGYRDFYDLFCKFYNKIKIEYFDIKIKQILFIPIIKRYSFLTSLVYSGILELILLTQFFCSRITILLTTFEARPK